MPVRYCDRYTIRLCRDYPEHLFIFGDNWEAGGTGGTAILRWEPNALGIPTKWAPRRDEDAYFADKDLPVVIKRIVEIASGIRRELVKGRTVIFPAGGIGTGLAELPTRAPAIFRLIDEELEKIGASAKGGRPDFPGRKDEAARLRGKDVQRRGDDEKGPRRGREEAHGDRRDRGRGEGSRFHRR